MQPIDFFKHAARFYPDRQAVYDTETQTSLTYEQLNAQVDALAAFIQAQNPSGRAKISILADNSLEMLLVILATYASNGIIIPLTPTDVESTLKYQLDSVAPDYIFYAEKYSHLIEFYQGDRLQIELLKQGVLNNNQIKSAPTRPAANLSDTAAIKFTGGSTGLPKAVIQSHRCISTMVMSLCDVYEFDEQEKFLICAPLTHGAGTFVLPVLNKGGQLVITNRRPANELLDLIHTLEITSLWLPPTLLLSLTHEQERKGYPLPKLKNILYGGGPCTPNLQKRVLELFGPKLGVTYGLTEAPVIISGMPGKDSQDSRNFNSAGRIGPMSRVAVCLGEGNISEKANQVGEIVVCGDLLMDGYLNMEEETQKAIKSGWLYTGDIGYIDERGYLFIKGRSKDIIISGGFNIYPIEIEELYSKHEKVLDCFVYGHEDEYWGERVEIAIVLDKTEKGPDQIKEQLIEYGRKHLGSIKTPKKMHFVNKLAKNELGKFDKQLILKEIYQNQTEGSK